MRFLELKDVIRLLRSEVERAGGQTVWAKKTGINRPVINTVLNGHQPPTKKIIRALKLRTVFVPKR
jgi:DNA-binding phage protein